MKTVRFASLVPLAVLALGHLTAAGASTAPVLLDGGFEDPALAANSFVAGGGTSWTPVGSVFVISNDYESFGNTPYGTQYLDLNDANTSDSQSVSGFVAGQTYFLGADFSDIQDGVDPSLTLSVSGAAVASSTFTGTVGGPYGTGTFAFSSAGILFAATTSGSVTITLTNSSGPSGNAFFPALAVDNVSLYGFTQTPTIPEPATTAGLLLGVAALAGVTLRRQSRRS